ncbi:hypothetical protein BS50DRAFT_347014 [Corynespora cassiicola Philippines]|uniref:Mediator complex subunit 15 KIX domain-containing protein n=1 Tax=Corynespora cassiicola Philippines TaxID=1448308 RepID=A0A2T2NQJ2_CORCC|nr:hypothetical protein BS50DRAFT_347014 [Corynespora cassiicola Philippines]
MNNPNFQNMMAMNRGNQNVQQHLMQHYRNQQAQGKIPQGWQQTVQPQERAALALQFYTSYRLVKPDLNEMEAMRMSMQFETQAFNNSPSKDQYQSTIKSKFQAMQNLRQQQAQGMQNNLNNPMNAMNAMNQMGMMGQPGVQAPRQNTPQQFPQGFANPQLQRPMQASPIPMAQNPSQMGMNAGNPQGMQQGQNGQQPNMQQGQPQNYDENLINQFARRLMTSAKEETRQRLEQEIAQWPEQKKQAVMARGMPPIFQCFREQAVKMLRAKQLNPQQALAVLNQDQNAGGMQQQLNQMQGQAGMNQRQGNQNFDFNALANQQIEALRVQDQGQTVVPASNNPNAQMVGFGGQNAQAGQQQNASLAQRQAAQAAFQNAQRQQAAQAQAQAHAQAQAQAQAQARAQQQMQQQAQARAQAVQNGNANQLLQGQVGGLNLPPGTQQPSPAMPMLNRPLGVPPGQPGPRTPQQTPQAHVPVMTPQGNQPQGMQQVDPQVATQLMREAQQRAAAAAQGQQPLTDTVRMGLIPPEMDPVIKAQLLKIPEPQFRSIIQSYMTNLRRTNPIANGGPMPGGQAGPGQPNMIMNPAQALQMAIPSHMMNGANMANMGGRPNMNMGQATPGQMGGQPGQMGQPPGGNQQAQRLMDASNLLRSSPGIIQATDHTHFPPNVINPSVRQHLPPDCKSWIQLKQWASQNPQLMPGVNPNKLLLLQVLHFQDVRRQSNMQQNGGRPQQNNVGGMAPQAPMAGQGPPRPPQQQQQQPNMPNVAAIQVSPQEIQMFRQKLPPNQAGVSDDQLRTYIQTQKYQAFLKSQHLRNVQAQTQQRPQGPQQQPGMPGQGPQATRPPSAQPQPAQITPQQAKPANKPQQPPQTTPQPAQNALKQGVKRPNEDTEVNADASNANAAPQAPAMVPSGSRQGVNLTQEQMSKLNPQQQAQMRAQLLKAQDASNNKPQQRPIPSPEEIQARMADPARKTKFRLMVNEEDQKTPRGQPVQMSPEARAQVQALLKDKFPHFKKVEQALRIFLVTFEGVESENMARTVMKARLQIMRQINMQDGSLLPEVTLSEAEIKENIRRIFSFVGKVMSTVQNHQQSTKPPQGQQPQGSQAQAQGRPPQLNAANLKIVEEQQRQNKVPQAPTTEKPDAAIHFGGQSPRGAPTYFDTAPPPVKLKLPDKKRPKMDPSSSQTSTPGAKPSPHMGSAKNSPEMKRQAPPEPRPTFKCRDPSCPHSTQGFDSQPELDAHVAQAHSRIDDPQQFAIDSMASYLDVDVKTGLPKTDPNASRLAATAKPAPPARPAQPAKSGQTPSVPQNATTPAQAAATPMTRVPTQTGVKSSPSTNLLKTPQTGAKVATPSTGGPTKATPTSMAKPAAKQPENVAVLEPEKEEDLQPVLPSSLFDFSYDEIYPALDNNGPLTVLDLKDEDASWVLRSRPSSPIETPDSSTKDTPSTRQSDISENDNLQIRLDIKEPVDVPDAWNNALNNNTLPLDAQLSEDLQHLGVTLPPMDQDDMMLFYGDSIMMDLDTLDRTMDSMDFSASLDPAVLTT